MCNLYRNRVLANVIAILGAPDIVFGQVNR